MDKNSLILKKKKLIDFPETKIKVNRCGFRNILDGLYFRGIIQPGFAVEYSVVISM